MMTIYTNTPINSLSTLFTARHAKEGKYLTQDKYNNSHPPADSQPILQIQALFEGIPQFPEFFKSIQQHRGFVYYFLNNAQSLIQFSSMRFLYYHLIKTKR